MNETTAGPARVPPRLVLASIFGLWATYFLLATLRGAVLGYAFNWDLVSRRLVVTLAAMVVTAALWPLLARTGRRPFWLRAGLVLGAALPAALLISLINDRVFDEINNAHHAEERMQDGVSILRDANGNVVEIGNGRLVIRDEDGNVVIRQQGGKGGSASSADGPKLKKSFWEDNVDLILGRYFVLLAWAAIYLALANAEQARAAERREGDYRRAAQAAELRSLRYQINPHFLFNTLNSLSALVLTGKREAAERMIQTLSTFYRRGLAGDSTGDVTLDEEIGLQKLYLEIEAVRFPERLRTVVNVPLALSRAQVPGMILQPLVENSIKYAVAVSRSPVTVTIAAWAEDGTLVLSVGDDGPGAAVQDGCGIGLANVRDRLHARFDGAASLVAGPRPEGGFRTEIRLPLHYGNGHG